MKVLIILAFGTHVLGLQKSSRDNSNIMGLAATQQAGPEAMLARQTGCSLSQDASSEQQLYGQERVSDHCNAFESTGHLGSLFPQGGVDYLSFVHWDHKKKPHKHKDQMAVWISGYPRSGSSTLLSMVSATVDNNRNESDVFSLFEPCHGGDNYTEAMNKSGCGGLLWGLARCEFEGINDLWGWRDPHSTNNYTTFSSKAAHDLCAEADIVAFKTVDYGHNLAAWTWLLDSHPNMRMLDVVRDPRGIFASWKTLEPFKSILEAGEFYSLTEVCENFARNLDFEDDRVHRVRFEEMMNHPRRVTRQVYSFLGQPYTSKQEDWVHGVFNNTWCPPPGPNMKGFTDCHTESAEEEEKWHSVLTDEEKADFLANEDCRRVAERYGYPLESEM